MWEALIPIAVALMERADDILDFARSLGASQVDLDESIAKHRAARKAQIEAARDKEWPA